MSDNMPAVPRKVRTPDHSIAISAPVHNAGDATRFHDERRPRKRRWSLAVRLPLLLFAALVVVFALFGTSAYRMVRDSAIEVEVARMSTATRELAAYSARNLTTRAPAVLTFASGPIVRRVLETPGDSAAVAALDSVMHRGGANDTTLVAWAVQSTTGALRAADGTLSSADSAVLSESFAQTIVSGNIERSRWYHVGNHVRVVTTVPIRVDGNVTGTLSDVRRLVVTPQTETMLKRLIGSNVRVMYAAVHSDEWSTVQGAPLRAPFSMREDEDKTERFVDSSGVATFLTQARVANTPWLIVMAQPESEVLAAPNAFLRRMTLIGLALLLLGTAAAWWFGRREAQPLVDMQEAAEAMARGDYRQFVAPAGGAEMAALAETFNAMAGRIADAHAVLEHQNVALQRANEAKARFLAVMSHELRTPLNAIGGFADLLMLGVRGPTTPAQLQDLERIQQNKNQLLNIVTDILHYTRLHDEQHLDRGQVVRLEEELLVVDAAVRPLFERKSVMLRIAPTHSAVRADAACFRKVMEHLLSNALKFTPTGGEVHVYTDTSPSESVEGFVRVRVADNGIGMSKEVQVAIFEPFMQVDDSLTRRSGGTGLGLAMVRELTVAMGGSVHVDSTPGKGSVFTIALPAVAA